MVRRKADRARVVREVVQPEWSRLVDQHPEDAAARRRAAEQAPLLVVSPVVMKRRDAAVGPEHPERGVPGARDARRGLDDRLQRLVEVEPARDRDAGLDDLRELVVLCGRGCHACVEDTGRSRAGFPAARSRAIPDGSGSARAANYGGVMIDSSRPRRRDAHAARLRRRRHPRAARSQRVATTAPRRRRRGRDPRQQPRRGRRRRARRGALRGSWPSAASRRRRSPAAAIPRAPSASTAERDAYDTIVVGRRNLRDAGAPARIGGRARRLGRGLRRGRGGVTALATVRAGGPPT